MAKVVMKILFFEKNSFFKESLIRIIECRFPDVVIKTVLSSEECLNATSTFIPDILLLGHSANSEGVLLLLEQVNERCPSINIILFTNYNIDEYRKEAVLKGASHVISRDLWTGNEILALINTIFTSKESLMNTLSENLPIEDFLELPIERRKNDPRGKSAEREFLAHHPDRRKENTKSGFIEQHPHSSPTLK